MSLTIAGASMNVLTALALTWLPLPGLLLVASPHLRSAWRCRTAFSGETGWAIVGRALAYSLPATVSLFGVIALSGSFDLGDMVAAQYNGLPYVVYQPLGVLVLGVSLAAGVRPPPAAGDPPAGPLPGRSVALYRMCENLQLLLVGALIAIIYLAGDYGPGSDGLHWLALKMLLVAIPLVWLRDRWLTRRGRWLTEGGWAALTLLAALNALVTGVVLVWRG